MDRIFLQFGEVANNSLVHLWNYFSFDEEADADIKKNLFGNSSKPRTLIYSDKIGLKGILSQGQVKETAEALGSSEVDNIINRKTGRWTDFNYGTEFLESSYREINQFDPTRNFLSSFYDSKGKASFLDDFEEDVRKLAEGCDWLEGFNFVSEGCAAVGASTLHALEHLNDEYTKSPKVVLSFTERLKVSSVDSVNWENCDRFDGGEVGNAIKFALTFNSISDQNVTFIPIGKLSQMQMDNFNVAAPRETSRLFSSIIYDLFGQQSVPSKGNFASLIASTGVDKSFNFTKCSKYDDFPLSKWRKSPIVLDELNYKFDWIDLVSFADFNPNSFAVPKADKFLEITSQPRPIWQLLESAGVSDELAAGDYFQELRETLHQIKDQDSIDDLF